MPLLRERLGVPAKPRISPMTLTLAAAVRKFQQANELPATGNLDARTVKELNGPVKDKQIDLVIANMERWRWYPATSAPTNVIVNQPDFTLKVMHNGAQVWTTRVVIGDPSPGKQTPLLSETMKSVTVNPTWNVPPSIMYNEYMPGASAGSDRARTHGFECLLRALTAACTSLSRQAAPMCSGGFVSTSPTGSWCTSMIRMSGSCLRTRCGLTATAACACRILRNMPRFSSTLRVPASTGRSRRSSECSAGASRIFSCNPAPIWVHVTYQSAFVDDNGKLQVRRDVYNLDSRTLAADQERARHHRNRRPRARASSRKWRPQRRNPAGARWSHRTRCRSCSRFSSAPRRRRGQRARHAVSTRVEVIQVSTSP